MQRLLEALGRKCRWNKGQLNIRSIEFPSGQELQIMLAMSGWLLFLSSIVAPIPGQSVITAPHLLSTSQSISFYVNPSS